MGTAGGFILLIVAIAIYFLPSIIAGARNKSHGTAGVVLLNIFLGWTAIGWLVAFIWAFTGRTEAEARREEQRHAETLAAIAAGKPQGSGATLVTL